MGLFVIMSSCGSSDSVISDDNNENPSEKPEQPEEPKLDLSGTEDFVDLGLSVKWAKWNFGAKSIDEQGDLYAWGELETKSKYILANYQKPAYLLETGDSYNRSVISGSQWDVVAMKNKDGSRIPTIKEYMELVGYCDITIVNVDDKSYFKFTGKTGNSIYFSREHDECWLGNASLEKARKISLDVSNYYDWEELGFVDDVWKGYPIRPVLQEKIMDKPIIELSHVYNENSKRDMFYIEVDENTVSRYQLKGYEYSGAADVGMIYSSNPNILASKENLKTCDFLKQSNNVFRNSLNLSFKDGEEIYAVPYVMIGGVCYFSEEIKMTMGSDLPRYAVGDYYPNSYSPEGVVCDIETGGIHGKIISLSETVDKWDVNSISTSSTGANSGTNGVFNTNMILKKTGHPAAKWCREWGADWYFPARYELTKVASNVAVINQALGEKGYGQLDGLYWSSTEQENLAATLAYIVCITETTVGGYKSGWSGYNSKTNNRNVRAMKKF